VWELKPTRNKKQLRGLSSKADEFSNKIKHITGFMPSWFGQQIFAISFLDKNQQRQKIVRLLVQAIIDSYFDKLEIKKWRIWKQ